MALNLIIPNPVPALDVGGLLKLITDPLAANAMWKQYEQARADYEALRAEIEALAKEVETGQKKLWQDSFDFDAEKDKLVKAKQGFAQEVKDWDVAKAEYLRKVQQKNADAEAKLAEWKRLMDAFKEAEDDLKQEKINFDKFKLSSLAEYTAKGKELEAREAAVALRETNASKLEKLVSQFKAG